MSYGLAQAVVQNLSHNVMMDHLDYVDHGVRPADDDYYTFKKSFWVSGERKNTELKLWSVKTKPKNTTAQTRRASA